MVTIRPILTYTRPGSLSIKGASVLIGTESILSSTEFQMSLPMFVALGGYFDRLPFYIESAIVGIILAGVLVGPSYSIS